MQKNTMLPVTVDGRELQYPAGTPYETIVREVQPAYENDILLVSRDGKLRELRKTLDRSCRLSMITAVDKPGYQTYERSCILLFLKAFYDVVGAESIYRVCVEHSVSHALLIRAMGDFKLDADLADRVQTRMEALTQAALPIRKRVMETYDAIEFFEKNHMPDKARVFRYRIGSRVNVYELDGFVDYFYGYMVPNTSYLKCYRVTVWPEGGGLLLRLPAQSDPKTLGDFTPSLKVARAQYDATLRAEEQGIANVGELNEQIAAGRAGEIILSCEARMEKQIGDIAQRIARRRDIRFIMIAGPSSSGKTTFSHRLSTQLRACGLRPHPIATDNYFRNRSETPIGADGQPDFECLEAMDVEGFNRDMLRLLNGETVELPHYNFKKGVREYNGDHLTLGESDVLVIEGIHCLNDQFSHALPEDRKYKVYISCLTTLNIDDHNRIPTTDARLLRRIERDARTRGYGAAATIRMWPSVRRGEESHIFPYQDSADVVFNSALIYETALLRPYIEPLLFGIPKESEEYAEARRLLKFLNYFLPVPADMVPLTSIAREFIGGGCYNV